MIWAMMLMYEVRRWRCTMTIIMTVLQPDVNDHADDDRVADADV